MEETNQPSTSFQIKENLKYTILESIVIDQIVWDLMDLGTYYVEDDETGPEALAELNVIAEKEAGWIQVASSIINVIPFEDNFGPSIISFLIDDLALPSKDSVLKIIDLFRLSRHRAQAPVFNLTVDRNMCVFLGCIAEKLVGSNSVALFTQDVREYLLTLISTCSVSSIVLYALIALEKFACISNNKEKIIEWMNEREENPLMALESQSATEDYIWRQVGFCAQWALDNIFPVEGRRLSYEVCDMSEVRVILNCRDMSDCLKISPNGLEARCDSYTFESVRSTFRVDQGSWYYEVTIFTPGVMQIGWATRNSVFMNHENVGVGDDLFSISFDGCRRIIWYNGRANYIRGLNAWRPGDVVGCFIDIADQRMIFYINGLPLQIITEIFKFSCSGFFAAASFMAFQHCRFNFGTQPFKYPPPDRSFLVINDFGELTDDEKKVLPKRLMMENLGNSTFSESDDLCVLCYGAKATCVLEPCGHRGFCSSCSTMVIDCPLCREDIENIRSEV